MRVHTLVVARRYTGGCRKAVYSAMFNRNTVAGWTAPPHTLRSSPLRNSDLASAAHPRRQAGANELLPSQPPFQSVWFAVAERGVRLLAGGNNVLGTWQQVAAGTWWGALVHLTTRPTH